MAGQRQGTALAKRMLEWWVGERPTLAESTAAFEEVFLWGCQTAQRSAGVATADKNFIVGAAMLLNTRRTRMLGWRLVKRDGTATMLLFKDAEAMRGIQYGVLFPVIRKKKKQAKKLQHA